MFILFVLFLGATLIMEGHSVEWPGTPDSANKLSTFTFGTFTLSKDIILSRPVEVSGALSIEGDIHNSSMRLISTGSTENKFRLFTMQQLACNAQCQTRSGSDTSEVATPGPKSLTLSWYVCRSVLSLLNIS
jgi:hypothetical protein